MAEIRPLAEMRRMAFAARDPAAVWADIARPGDVAAMRFLVAAVMADIRRKPSWAFGWKLATRCAYHAVYKPFGAYMAETGHLRRLIGEDLVSAPDLAGLQRLYTLAHAGCSAVLAWDAANGRMVHFRSLDWPSAGAIAGATRIFSGIGADGRQAFSAVGILGMTGLLTAVKPGFSVAINFAPWRGPSITPGTDPTFLLRRLMQSSAGSYQEAYRQIARWRPGAPVFVTLCGIARGEGCCFEFGRRGPGHAIPLGGRDVLVQTNHFDPAGPFARQRRRQAEPLAWDDPAWDGHAILATSEARRALLEQELACIPSADIEAGLRQVFARRPVWNGETAQWAMMVPQTGQMQAWVRNSGERNPA